MIPSIIHTKRLTLRPHTSGDLPMLRVILRDSRVMKYSGLDVKNYLKNADTELEWFRQLDESDTGIRWVISLNNENSYIGDLGFLDIDKENHRAEVSYKLSGEQWNKGIITEALRAILCYGFDALKLNKVTAETHIDNTASHRVLTKHGFKLEGTLREHEYLYGKYADVYVFGLLQRDYSHISTGP
ncbi:MAG: GNAT family N-acetyltransferase [Candidatus Bathyarchaeota archaeon]|nr:GNAT family N-acetyltransferase [Candidatus Bathyarchaeota archaeon]